MSAQMMKNLLDVSFSSLLSVMDAKLTTYSMPVSKMEPLLTWNRELYKSLSKTQSSHFLTVTECLKTLPIFYPHYAWRIKTGSFLSTRANMAKIWEVMVARKTLSAKSEVNCRKERHLYCRRLCECSKALDRWTVYRIWRNRFRWESALNCRFWSWKLKNQQKNKKFQSWKDLVVNKKRGVEKHYLH